LIRFSKRSRSQRRTAFAAKGPRPTNIPGRSIAVIKYTFPGTAFTEGETVAVTWYDGKQRPPVEVQTLAKVSRAAAGDKRNKLPGQGSIFVGTQGVMLLPHIGQPRLVGEAFEDSKIEEAQGEDHWRQFVDAALGNGKTSANFDYAGPLTESVLLGSVASRFPNTTLEWDAGKLSFTNVAEANQFVRRAYRKGWEVAGL
jgi:hypothetical protein